MPATRRFSRLEVRLLAFACYLLLFIADDDKNNKNNKKTHLQ